jgi:protoheme IX farnesyltransferase
MKNSPFTNLKDYIALGKLKVMIPVSLTGFTGYFLLNPFFTIKLFILSFGILLLAIAASVLNQIQEIEYDSKMDRTFNRPLPSGKISKQNALVFCILCFISGLIIIWLTGNIRAAIIGIFTIIWYNGVYTYLKRVTAFAVVPGAITGALPPFIGWVAAGGAIFDKPVIFVGFLIFIGQIPHFWLLLLNYGEEYSEAGLPSLTDIFSRKQINRLSFTWMVTSVFAALFLCYFEIIQKKIIIGILLIASVYLIWQFSYLFKTTESQKPDKKYLRLLDAYFLLVLLLLISDKIIS